MTSEEVVKGLKTHLDNTIDCDNCPGRDIVPCFEMLIFEAIRLIEQAADKATTGETPEANKKFIGGSKV